MDVLNGPPPVHTGKSKGGRPRGAMTFSKKSFIELARKNPGEAFENLRHLALHDENSFVRLAATKIWIEYSSGKPPEGEGGSSVTEVRVITGVPRRDYVPGELGYGPVMPDGTRPFETHAAKPAPRPAGRPACAEPPQHRLYEAEAKAGDVGKE